MVGINDGSIVNCHTNGIITINYIDYSDYDYYYDYTVGGFVLWNRGNISNCSSSGEIINNMFILYNNHSGLNAIGGLVCYNEGDVSNCFSNIDIGGKPVRNHVGGLIALNEGLVNNCYTTGDIICYENTSFGFTGCNVGGLIGRSTRTTISNCYTTGDIIWNFNPQNTNFVGGLIGDRSGSVINCYTTGNVTASGKVGGLLGNSFGGQITNCYTTGDVHCDDIGGICGGLIGYAFSDDVSLCYTTGIVTATARNNIGGLIGVMGGSISNCYARGNITADNSCGLAGISPTTTVTNCYSTGLIIGENTNGLINGTVDQNPKVINCFWDRYTSGQNTSAGGTGKTTKEMKTKTTFSENNWNFYHIWAIDEKNKIINDGYPYFKNFILLAPMLISPPNTAKSVPSIPTFVWQKVVDAKQYIFALSKDTLFSKYLYYKTISDTTFTLPSELELATTYYWRVLAKTDEAISDWSVIWEFTTEIGPPILISPKNNSIDITIDTTLLWHFVTDALRYKVQLSKEADFANLLIDDYSNNGTSHNINNLEYETTYYWRVASENTHGTSLYSNAWQFTTNISPVILTSPENNAVDLSSSVNMEWQKNNLHLNYQLQLARENTFGNTIIKDTIIENTLECEIHKLIQFKDYFWKVRVKAENERFGLWSEIRKFTLGPQEIILVYPDSTQSGQAHNFQFKWEEIYGAEYYQLQVSKNIHFTDLVFSKDSLELLNPIDGKVGYNITDLEENTKYFWRVRAWSVETYDMSEWSVIWYFTTGASSISDDLELEIKIMPNPISKGQILTILNIPIYLREYNVKIYDINGNLISQTNNLKEIELNNNFNVGTYLLIIESNGSIISREKFIVK